MKRNFLLGFFIVAVFFFFVSYYFLTAVNFDNIKYVKIAGQNIKVILAETTLEQNRGLSGREKLNENEGMLFVFNHEGNYPFWMKDMNFPIDIIWLDENLKVVYIKKNALPQSYPESFSPGTNAKYVLEVNAGFSEKNNLKEGDTAEFK